jgi:FkbM family methyltransferase
MRLLRKLRVALTPRNRLLKTTLPGGAVVFGRNQRGYGGRGIYVLRDAIEAELAHLGAFLEPTDVFVDVGASTGIYALEAAVHVGACGVVVAVEPFPDVYATLHHSIRANGFTQVRARSVCLGARIEPRTLWLNFGRPSLFSTAERAGDAPGLSVLAVSLDDLLRWEGLDRVAYVKIDAEGAEEEILTGATRTIARCRPIVQIEVSVRRLRPKLPDYLGFQAAGSPNAVYVPNDHPKLGIPARLGWLRLPDGA